jgi:hypothetical protein
VAVALTGLAGLWGVVLAIAKRQPPSAFGWAVGLAIAAALIQVASGLVLYAQGARPVGLHTFYGVVITATFAVAYAYRTQIRTRPALGYGVLLLFVMGLGLRAIQTFAG